MSEASEPARAEPERTRYAWVVVVAAMLLALSMNLTLFSPGPLLTEIRESVGASFAVIGLIFTAPVLLVSVLAILGGVLADTIGIRKVAGTGAVLLGLGGLLRGLATDFLSFVLVSMLFGAGMGLVLPNLPKAIRGWFPRSLLGVASGIYVVGFPIGAMTAAGATGFVARAFGTWRGAFLVWGALVLLFAAIWWIVVREPRLRRQETTAGLRLPRAVARNVYLWIIAGGLVTTTLMFGIEVAWFPTLLAERGASTLDAGLLVSLLIAGNLVGVVTIPALSDRVGLRRPFLWGFGILSIVGLVVLILTPVPVAWMVLPLLGFALSGPFTMGFVLPGDFIEYNHLGAASGIVLSLGWLGIAFGSLLAGSLRDISGGFESTLYALLVGAGTTITLAFILPEPGRKRRGRQPGIASPTGQ